MLDRFTVRPLCCWMLDFAFHRAARSYIFIGKLRAKICKLLIIRAMRFQSSCMNVKKLYSWL